MRLAVLASGTGSIFSSMLDVGIDVALLVVDRGCGATTLADWASVPSVTVERETFGADFDRDGYTASVVAVLRAHEIDVVAMAGFGTVLGAEMFEAFPNRVLNTHPALLPAFKGWHAVQDALDAGVDVTGCTVHVATAEVDDGPILAQEEVPVRPDDTVESLHERIKTAERRIYPATIATFLERLEGTPA